MMIKNGKVYKSYKQRAEAAEARAADLAESNREQAEAIEMLRAELDLANAHAARLMQERDEARRQLVEVTAIKNDAITANEKLASKILKLSRKIEVHE